MVHGLHYRTTFDRVAHRTYNGRDARSLTIASDPLQDEENRYNPPLMTSSQR